MELPKYIVMKVDCEPKSTTVTITDISDRCEVIEHEAEQTEPQTLDDIGKQIQDAYDKGIISDADATQAWYEAVNKTEPQTERLEQFRVGLEYHTNTTHFGKVKGESITTNKIEDEPQTDCAWK